MRRALRLAEKGEGFVHPNPLVGAVLYKDDTIIGEGFHEKIGKPHAEINAIASARKAGCDPSGATMVVTLEPCAHFGKTPPCVEAIADARIAKVVIGLVDPNPLVAGRGIGFLREKGVLVTERVLEKECADQNEAFIKYITQKKPFVLLKAAMTLDGKIATRTGKSRWISSPASRDLAHRLRRKYQAVMVGAGTVIADDPELTCRLAEGRVSHPIRIILDGRLSIPPEAKVVAGTLPEKTIVATTAEADPDKRRRLEDAGCELLIVPGHGDKIDLAELMAELGAREIASLMIEGGSSVHEAALQARIVDKVLFFIAPKIFGGKDAPTAVGGPGVEEVEQAWRLAGMSVKNVGPDLVVEGKVQYPDQ